MFEKFGYKQFRIVTSFYEGDKEPSYFTVQFRKKDIIGWNGWFNDKSDLSYTEAFDYIKEQQRIQNNVNRNWITKVHRVFR